MTREIKFRGKKFCQDEWIYGSLITRGERGADGNFIDTGRGECYPLQQDTIGQYTGLHDKNGKEIYEGDILHVIAETDDIHDYITQVSTNGLYEVDLVGCEYDITILAWLSANYDECCTIEVIGNIYDNPELLKED